MKNNKRGFTLVELVIVIAILAVLAGIAVPTVSHLIFTSQETVCLSNRTDMERLYAADTLLNPNEDIEEYLKKTYGEHYDACPGGGSYYPFAYTEIGSEYIHIYCSVHDGSSTSMYVKACIMQKKLDGMTNEEKKDYLEWWENNNLSNDTKRRKLLKDNGGTWDPLEESVLEQTEYMKNNNNSYFVQPYVTNQNVALIFANTSDGLSTDWQTNLVFNPRDGKWYEYVKKHPHNDSRESFKMTAFKDMTQEQIFNSFENTDLWKAIG